jgi:hypothetical protein
MRIICWKLIHRMWRSFCIKEKDWIRQQLVRLKNPQTLEIYNLTLMKFSILFSSYRWISWWKEAIQWASSESFRWTSRLHKSYSGTSFKVNNQKNLWIIHFIFASLSHFFQLWKLSNHVNLVKSQTKSKKTLKINPKAFILLCVHYYTIENWIFPTNVIDTWWERFNVSFYSSYFCTDDDDKAKKIQIHINVQGNGKWNLRTKNQMKESS